MEKKIIGYIKSQRFWLEGVHQALRPNWFQRLLFNFEEVERCLSFIENNNMEMLEMLKDVKTNDRTDPKPITKEELDNLMQRFTLSDSQKNMRYLSKDKGLQKDFFEQKDDLFKKMISEIKVDKSVDPDIIEDFEYIWSELYKGIDFIIDDLNLKVYLASVASKNK